MEAYKKEVFQHYRETGFPYYKLSYKQRIKEFYKLQKFDLDSIIEGTIVRQTMHGLALCWYYHPYAFDVVCNGLNTALQAFRNDALLTKAIDKRIKHGTFMTDAGMRKTLRSMSGVQAVSNFRPSAAAAIYKKYGGGDVWDMSAGFGGRLVGAQASGVKSYIGTDPSVLANEGNRKLRNDLQYCSEINVNLILSGSENYTPDFKSLDMCFTSPPYFNTEKYSNDADQSYIKYPEQKQWLNGYLRKTLKNCYYGLKDSGYLIINIANVKSYPELEKDFVTLAESLNFKLVETLQYQLSRMMGTRQLGTFKYEPIFVFKKNI